MKYFVLALGFTLNAIDPSEYRLGKRRLAWANVSLKCCPIFV